MFNTKIVGSGSSVPQKILTNNDLEKIVETSDEWITTRTGIKERRIMENDEKISDHCIISCKRALKQAFLDINDIDLIINATFTADYPLPSTACIIQEGLGAKKHIPSFDIAAACSGWVYGLETARNYISSGNYKNILVVGGDAMSSFTNWKDRSTCVLFGDGAGAAVAVATEDTDNIIVGSDLGAIGKYSKILDIPGGGSVLPPDKLLEDSSLKDKYYIRMAGNELFKIVTRLVINSINRLLKKVNMTIDEIDLIIPHQANIRIIEYIAKKLKLPMEKMAITLDKYGNSSAGTIPITLDYYLKENRIKKGDNIVFTAFGGGLTYASLLARWAI